MHNDRVVTLREAVANALGQDGQPVALTVVEPPQAAAWIANMARPGATAYLQTMIPR